MEVNVLMKEKCLTPKDVFSMKVETSELTLLEPNL